MDETYRRQNRAGERSSGSGPELLVDQREPPGLPCVKEIAGRDRDGRARQNRADNKVRRESAYQRTQGENEEKLKQIIDKQSEEAVDIAPDEPFHFSPL